MNKRAFVASLIFTLAQCCAAPTTLPAPAQLPDTNPNGEEAVVWQTGRLIHMSDSTGDYVYIGRHLCATLKVPHEVLRCFPKTQVSIAGDGFRQELHSW